MCSKVRHEIPSDFITARTDARTDSGHEIIRLAAEFPFESINGSRDGAGDGAFPAGMNRGNRSGAAIAEKNWDTIRGSHRERDRRVASDGDVGLGPVLITWRRNSSRGNVEHVGTMHLPHPDERGKIDPKRACEIFPTRLIIVTHPFQHQITRAEAMRRNHGKRCASQSGSPGLLHPFEVAARLG